MKETIKINLGGRLFDLDIDAYQRLKAYLDSLKKYYNTASETEEILDGIEERIADLLAARLSSVKEVVSYSDIQEIIAVMGTAEEIDNENTSENESDESYSEPKKEHETSSYRHLYRDTDSSVLGGVCSGLAAYFNIDPTWIRLAFVLAFLLKGVGIILYIILWAVLPRARTTAQKLEMRGKPVNIDNIEREVKKEFSRVKDNFGNFKNRQGYQQTQHVVRDVFDILGKVILVFLKIVGFIIALSLLLVFLVLIISLFAGIGFLGSIFGFGDWTFAIPGFFHDFHNFQIFGFLVFLLIFIPIISLFIAFIRWISGANGKNRILGSFAATIWILALVTLIVFALSDVDHFALRESKSSDYKVKHKMEVPLYINLERFDQEYIENYQIFNSQYGYDSESNRMLRKPKINIKKSDNKDILIEMERKNFSFESSTDSNFGHQVADYSWSNVDSVLILDEYLKVRRNQGWRVPAIELSIYIPEGKTVYINSDFNEMIDYVYCKDCDEISDISGKKLKMTKSGLIVSN